VRADAILSILIRTMLTEVKSASQRAWMGEEAHAVESIRVAPVERTETERPPEKVAFFFSSEFQLSHRPPHGGSPPCDSRPHEPPPKHADCNLRL